MNAVILWQPGRERLILRVILSRRNLRTLLLKVADPDSVATISRDLEPSLRLEVHAEPDEVHYADRAPGQMPLWTEAGLQVGLDGEGQSS